MDLEVDNLFWRTGQTVIAPGFGMMDNEFKFTIDKVERLRKRFYVKGGIASGWSSMYDYAWDSDRQRWVHKSLPLDVEV